MENEYEYYKVGDLVEAHGSGGHLGIITRSNFWQKCEYLDDTHEFVGVAFAKFHSKQYPVRYINKVS